MSTGRDAPRPAWSLPVPPRVCAQCGAVEQMTPSGARTEILHDDTKHSLAPVAAQPLEPPRRVRDDDEDEDEDRPAPARQPMLRPIGQTRTLQRAAGLFGERDHDED